MGVSFQARPVHTLISSKYNHTLDLDLVLLTETAESMSRLRHMLRLPSGEDVVELLEAASVAVDKQYDGPGYSYVYQALHSVFHNSIAECADIERDPLEILFEALQDERSVLDRHNRKESKATIRRERLHNISEDLRNFPLRYLVLDQGTKVPDIPFEPIYQVTEHPDVVQAARYAQADETAARHRNALGLQAPVTSASKRRVRKESSSHDKLYDAPSPEHDFPEGNITLAEIAAFIPQSIKCWDVVDRILWNGAKTQDITNLINKYRLMPAGKIVNNTVYLMMRGQMDKRSKEDARYQGWTVGLHPGIEKPDNFDSDSISITGFRRPIVFRNVSGLPAQPVLFKDLAKGVAVWPQHGDALDLTRCVAWCVANPDEEIYYPTDFQKVLHKFLGGPIPPRACHTDAEVLLRIRSDKGAIKPRCRAKDNYEKGETEKARSDRDTGTQLGMLKRKRSNSWSRLSNGRFEMPLPKLPRSIHALRKSNRLGPSRKSLFHLRDPGSDEDTDDEYQGPRRAKKNKDAPRRSERKTTRISYAYEAMGIDEDEPYSKEEENDAKISGLENEEAAGDVDEVDEDKSHC